MRKTIFKLAAASIALSTLSVAAPAFAQDEAAAEEASGPITIVGGAAVVSDYRFRGVSLSDKDFAVQPYLTIKHESGLYAGVWGSNLAENPGDDIEVDLYAGFAGGDAITYDIGATYYVYPGISDFNYVEITGKLGTGVGPATVGAQVSYVPSQDNTGNNDNLYLAGSLGYAVPNTPATLTATVGYEDGAFADKKIDWSLGASVAMGSGFTVSAAYVDTDRKSTFAFKDSKAGAVFTLAWGF